MKDLQKAISTAISKLCFNQDQSVNLEEISNRISSLENKLDSLSHENELQRQQERNISFKNLRFARIACWAGVLGVIVGIVGILLAAGFFSRGMKSDKDQIAKIEYMYPTNWNSPHSHETTSESRIVLFCFSNSLSSKNDTDLCEDNSVSITFDHLEKDQKTSSNLEKIISDYKKNGYKCEEILFSEKVQLLKSRNTSSTKCRHTGKKKVSLVYTAHIDQSLYTIRYT